MLGVDRRTVARYLAGWCQRPSVKRDREAVRPYRAAIEASRARRGARGERRPGAWTADHERRRAVAVLGAAGRALGDAWQRGRGGR